MGTARGADPSTPGGTAPALTPCETAAPADIMVVEVAEVRGAPPERIVALAECQPDTLVALATRGDDRVRRWVGGSSADQVLRATTTPVFILLANAPKPERDPSLCEM